MSQEIKNSLAGEFASDFGPFDSGILNYGGTEENYGNKKITGFFKDSGTTEM